LKKLWELLHVLPNYFHIVKKHLSAALVSHSTPKTLAGFQFKPIIELTKTRNTSFKKNKLLKIEV